LLVHPAIAESCASAIDGVVSDLEGCDCLALAAVEGPDLLRQFAEVSDGRSDQGRDHPVAVVLTLCAAAVLAGMRSFTAIAGWVADVPAALMAELYGTPVPGYPSKTTLWRVFDRPVSTRPPSMPPLALGWSSRHDGPPRAPTRAISTIAPT
jgi:hypothetical protein